MTEERKVLGCQLDAQSRCAHYHSERDIVAIKFACCGDWYACYYCHQQLAGHAARVWPKNDFDTQALLCGRCGHTLTIWQYLEGGPQCPNCNAAFNPGCHHHHALYFAVDLPAL